MNKYDEVTQSMKKVTIEVVGIIFAVLVALAADEWVEEHNKNERKEMLLVNIRKEISDNSIELKRSLDDIKTQIEESRLILQQNKDNTYIEINDAVVDVWNISLPALRDTSWQSLTLQSEIFTLIDLNEIEQLSSIYSLQKSLTDTGRQLIMNFGESSADLSIKEQSKRAFSKHLYNLSTVQQLEVNLNSLLDEYLSNSK